MGYIDESNKEANAWPTSAFGRISGLDSVMTAILTETKWPEEMKLLQANQSRKGPNSGIQVPAVLVLINLSAEVPKTIVRTEMT